MNAIDRIDATPEDLAGLLAEIERLESVFEGWDGGPRGAAEAYGRVIEALHGEALRRLVRSLKSDPAALTAMKGALADEIVYAVLRRHQIVKASLNERVEAALASIRPMLASHGGDVELVKVAPPAVEVRFLGACDSCPASALTFHEGVKKAVQEACPEITEIMQARGSGAGEGAVHFVSPFALGAQGGWLPACDLADIPDGGLRTLELEGEPLLLSRRGRVVTCFQNACAHLGMPIDAGALTDGVLTCPHHGFQYELTSGECLTAREVQLQSHAVRVLGRRVEIRLAR